MKKISVKRIVSCLLAVCLMCAVSTGFVLATETDSPVTEELIPATMYLQGGEISYSQLNSNTMRVTISTNANTFASSLYHDIVIYKNGTLVYNSRDSKSNSTFLHTDLDFSASSGDFFSTYVTHYVSHNGYTEHCDTHRDSYF